jgi:hypothetical protein
MKIKKTAICQECKKEFIIKDKRSMTYCSKQCLGNHTKNENIKLYNQNPKKCLCCGIIIDYDNKRKDFCNHSCSATYTNKKRIENGWTLSDVSKQQIGLTVSKKLKIYFQQNPRTKSPTYKAPKEYPTTNIKYKQCEKCNIIFISPASRSSCYCTKCRYENKTFYRKSCRFSLSSKKHSELFDFEMIKNYGWYRPHSAMNPNPTGVTWDHLYQIQEGYKNNISFELIKHPANAEMVPYKENFNRRISSTITLNELFLRIVLWEFGNHTLPRYIK